MSESIFFVLLVFGLLIVSVFIKRTKPKKKPYALNVKSVPILSDNEREFFHRLIRALPEHHVFPQVGLGALLQPGRTNSYGERQSNLGRFNQLRADYVVCERESLKVLAVIELDDSTHKKEKDDKRDAMLESADYRTIRFHSKKKPTEEEISKYFSEEQPRNMPCF